LIDKAERLIALMLRDDLKVLPEAANSRANNICRWLYGAMSVPTNTPLHGYRIISDIPPWGVRDGFRYDLAKYIPDVNDNVARRFWQLVYERGRDLAGTVADPSKKWAGKG
jgi:hypothetical protein